MSDYPTFPEARRRGLIPDPTPELDPIEDLIEQATNAHNPVQGMVYAQIATVRAIQSLALEMQIEAARTVQRLRAEFREGRGL
jgi:hypothetical protein